MARRVPSAPVDQDGHGCALPSKVVIRTQPQQWAGEHHSVLSGGRCGRPRRPSPEAGAGSVNSTPGYARGVLRSEVEDAFGSFEPELRDGSALPHPLEVSQAARVKNRDARQCVARLVWPAFATPFA